MVFSILDSLTPRFLPLMMPYDTKMRWKAFFLYHLFALLLFTSWLFMPTRAVWDRLDLFAFSCLNLQLEMSPLAQIFWALTNLKSADLFGALFMGTFFVLYVIDGEHEERKRRISQFIYLCIWGEIGILLSKEFLAIVLQMIPFARECPTLVYSHAIKLSHAIPWLKVKDVAKSSFPSDHGEIIFQWLSFIWFFCRWRYGLVATLWSIFFILPRLVAGAHWASDMFVGSMTFVLILLAWATATPIYGYTMNFLDCITKKIPFWKRKEDKEKEKIHANV